MSEFKVEDIIKEEGFSYQSSSGMRLVEMSRRGISKKSLLRLAELSSVSVKQLAELLPVSLRTIQRYNNNDLLDPVVSEHAILIAEVLSKGSQVFSSLDSLQHWLHTPSAALGNKTPLSYLDTGFGARLVTDELGRLEHGVYS